MAVLLMTNLGQPLGPWPGDLGAAIEAFGLAHPGLDRLGCAMDWPQRAKGAGCCLTEPRESINAVIQTLGRAEHTRKDKPLAHEADCEASYRAAAARGVVIVLLFPPPLHGDPDLGVVSPRAQRRHSRGTFWQAGRAIQGRGMREMRQDQVDDVR